MKRALTLLILFVFSVACVPTAPAQPPAETLVALTLAALPKTETFTPAPSASPTVTQIVSMSGGQAGGAFSAPGMECLPTGSERTQALVTRVLDGESIEVVVGNETYQVRYIGLDAPGIVPQIEWQGPQAISVNDQLASGQFVTLVQDVLNTDENGFLLRYVLSSSLFINYELIHRGYALAVSSPPNISCDSVFQRAQNDAQAAILGIWIPTPIPTATITLTPTITPVPTATRKAVCDCKGPKLTCNSFSTQAQAQACFEYCVAEGYGDIFLMDKNNNGKACEGLE